MATIALSFDNGPDEEVTPRVLEVLARRGIKASFFVLGSHLQSPARKRLTQRAAAEGHWIGNHSFSHKVPLGEDYTPDAVGREIAATEALIGDLAQSPRLFRPFGGGGKIGHHLLSVEAVEYLTANHYSCVLWNCVPEDWIYTDGWMERALEECARNESSLVVLHDILPAAMAHLDGFIGAALAAGHRFVQEYPAACVPIRDGVVLRDLAPLTRRA